MTIDPTNQDPNANNGGLNAMPKTGRPGRRVFIETYGCQMNLADSELMGGLLATDGFDAAATMDDADVVIINTCAVREKAEERVFGRLANLLPLKHKKPDLVLGVAGCMAEHLKESIVKRAPYVDLVIGPDAYRRLPQLLAQAQDDATDPLVDVKLDRDETYEGVEVKRRPGVNAWISVQRGCDKFCTFCVVPYTRGRERGVPLEDIMAQARQVAEAGYKEITLLGQTVNSYRWEDLDFADVLENLVEIDGIERIRFTSPYPTDFSPKLIATMAKHKKISKYLHMPAQSGSDRILESMRRQYTRGDFDKLVTDIRAAMPNVAISTDIIVGYPGETDDDYEATLDLLRKSRFDFGFLFKYSERSLTYAARKIADDIPEAVKKTRLKEVIRLQEEIGNEVFASTIGNSYEVLVEGNSRRDENQLCGRTDDFKMTVFDKPDYEIKPGELVNVTIHRNTSHTLIGQLT